LTRNPTWIAKRRDTNDLVWTTPPQFFMTGPMKLILLVNPISGRGHLDAYARLYSRALIELGYRVILLAEADGDTTNYLARNNPGLVSSFSFASFDRARYLRRALVIWQEEGIFGLLTRCIRVPLRGLSSITPQPIQSQVNWIGRAAARRLLRTPLARALRLPLYFNSGRIRFRTLLRHVDKTLAMPKYPVPDLIVFLYLDLLTEEKRDTAALDQPGVPPWIGILFHPRLAQNADTRIEGYFKSRNARGGVFLIPSAVPAYAKATPHLHFALAPDVADLELSATPSKLATEMRERARDRTIVLQIGSITAHKGIDTLLDVIAAADPSRFFFAFIGKVYWDTFAEQKHRIRSFYGRPPENVYLSQHYIENERDYNSIIAASDIIYAVYQGFGSSSNSLTKAAGFRRPILVSENSLMGDRVLHFNIGSAAPEGDASTILEKLGWLAAQPKDKFGFSAFDEEQSLEALKQVLADALPSWLTDARSSIKPEETLRTRTAR
jgi:hypothetical protein